MRALIRLTSLAGLLTSIAACGGEASLSARLQVEDQALTNPRVLRVEQARSPYSAFVVIREDVDGTPGAAIAKVALLPGDNRGLEVPLERAARDGETLYAVLHRDTGQPDVFEFDDDSTVDPPLVNEGGDVVKTTFTVSVDAQELVPEVRAEDQVANPATRVRIALARAPGPAFLVLHEDLAGAAGPAIAHVALEPGEHTDVEIRLERDLVNGERLQAILHVDDGEIGVYEFDGLDGTDDPWLDAEGAPVAAPFTVSVALVQGPEVRIEDQYAEGLTRVVAEAVVARAPGFLVVHEANNGGFGAAIGHSPVGTGTTTEVHVDLDREVRDNERLFAVLHVDDGAIGVYEFDGITGLDAPAADDSGTIVATPFRVRVEPLVEVVAQTVAPVDSVQITRAVVGGPGWLVIRADDAGPGEILGQSSLQPGTNADVRVRLERAVLDQETLYATLHADDGVDEVFEYDGVNGLDMPLVDRRGGPVVQPFTVTFEPELTAEGHFLARRDEITVTHVTSPGPGFVLVYDDAGGPGELLGVASVPNGSTSPVTVSLARPAVQGERLFARLHRDSGSIGTFEYIGPGSADGPVEVDGQPLTVTFAVHFPALEVEDQDVDPTTAVAVSSAVSPAAGFVVVAENVDGLPGAILGAEAISGGTNVGLTVQLSRTVTNPERLLVSLHRDDGQLGRFEHADAPERDGPVELDEAPVRRTVLASFTPKVEVLDQTVSTPSAIVVDDVIAERPGWVVVRATTMSGGRGEILGWAPVALGSNLAVPVSLRRPTLDGETLVAVLHIDGGQSGAFEYEGFAFPQPDLEYQPGGAIYDDTFVVSHAP